MKNYLTKIQSVILILALTLSLSSCSYTKNTGSARNFSKKHYNHGIVKHKSNKDKSSADLAQSTENEKLSKKEKKEEAIVQLEQFIASKDLTASESVAPVQSENVVDKVKGLFTEAKNQLTDQKAEATTDKEENKIDKKIKRMEKFETMLSKMSLKMEEKLSQNPDASPAAAPGASPAANSRGLLGLLGGIFGITGFVFAFLPLISYLGLLLCIAAIVLGAIGMKDNKPWGLTGIILGSLGFLMFFLFFALVFAILI